MREVLIPAKTTLRSAIRVRTNFPVIKVRGYNSHMS